MSQYCTVWTHRNIQPRENRWISKKNKRGIRTKEPRLRPWVLMKVEFSHVPWRKTRTMGLGRKDRTLHLRIICYSQLRPYQLGFVLVQNMYVHIFHNIAICTCHVRTIVAGGHPIPSFLSLSSALSVLNSIVPPPLPQPQRGVLSSSPPPTCPTWEEGERGSASFVPLYIHFVFRPTWLCCGCNSSIWRLRQALFVVVLLSPSAPP